MKKAVKLIFNNKIIVLSMLTLVLVTIFTVQMTFSFFFSDSSAESEIVISGGVDLEASFLNQTNGELNIESEDLLPGGVIPRTLYIENKETSINAYIRLKSIFYIDTNENGSYDDEVASLAVQMKPKSTETSWQTVASDGWYYYVYAVDAEESIQVDLEFEVHPTYEGDPYYLGNDEKGLPFKIITKISAVQADNNGSGYDSATWPE